MTVLDLDFWIGVGVIAGIYGPFGLGLQLNVGFTGLINLGQAGFMAIGAYAMGMLVVDAGWPQHVANDLGKGDCHNAKVVGAQPEARKSD
jgi:ABC-type branched-subunit amino acid transport system permease subunit